MNKTQELESGCQHKWVQRLDGYEEQCIPAICVKCGKYSCGCKTDYGKMTEEQRGEFSTSGINGNSHEIEKRRKVDLRSASDGVAHGHKVFVDRIAEIRKLKEDKDNG